MTEKNIRRFQSALLLITNPIRSRIPSILSAVIPHVERNLYIIVQNPALHFSASDAEQQKQRIRPMLHAIYKQLTTTKYPSVDVLLHNVDAALKSSHPIRLPHQCEAVFADCSSSPSLYNYCREHFQQLDQNFELRSIDEKESKDERSTESVPVEDQDLFSKKSTGQYDRGVLGGRFVSTGSSKTTHFSVSRHFRSIAQRAQVTAHGKCAAVRQENRGRGHRWDHDTE